MITIDIFKVLMVFIIALILSGVIYIVYKLNNVYKLLKEDREVNVTIVPRIDGECDIFDR